MSDVPERQFTLEEATAMLPRLRELLPKMRSARDLVLSETERVRPNIAFDGAPPSSPEYQEALGTLREGTVGLATEGVIVRELDTGLVDFPAEREGRTVFLCWRLGEDEIGFWHEVDAGFGGRRAL